MIGLLPAENTNGVRTFFSMINVHTRTNDPRVHDDYSVSIYEEK